jgi:ribosomal protein L25 (general stress protein Ctc)
MYTKAGTREKRGKSARKRVRKEEKFVISVHPKLKSSNERRLSRRKGLN